MKELSLVDEVIQEPINGAHRSQEEMFEITKQYIKKTIIELETSQLKIEFLEHTKEFIQIRLELEKEKIQNETLLNERK